jgi:exodeoxyribonuclease-1
MAASYFFYDLETSGFSPRTARIMQFAGQRTDMDFKPIGEPINLLIKLSPDVLPEPDAVLITSITPQQTLSDGLTEAEFLHLFFREIVKPDTVFIGFNSVRFDDEFMRFLLYRNFYDAYEWQWKDGTYLKIAKKIRFEKSSIAASRLCIPLVAIRVNICTLPPLYCLGVTPSRTIP